MNNKTNRFILNSFIIGSLVLPVYLLLKSGWPEFLWCYVPILSFWIDSTIAEFEGYIKSRAKQVTKDPAVQATGPYGFREAEDSPEEPKQRGE